VPDLRQGLLDGVKKGSSFEDVLSIVDQFADQSSETKPINNLKEIQFCF
jgi:hypothetical protein